MESSDTISVPSNEQSPKAIMCIYSLQDETFYRQLQIYLSMWQRNGYIRWQEISIGDNIQQITETYLHQADLLLLLLTPAFFADENCYTAMHTALHEQKVRHIPIVPILARSSSWKESACSQLKALPGNELPIIEWAHQDRAYENIRTGLAPLIPGLVAHSENNELEPSSPLELANPISPYDNRDLVLPLSRSASKKRDWKLVWRIVALVTTMLGFLISTLKRFDEHAWVGILLGIIGSLVQWRFPLRLTPLQFPHRRGVILFFQRFWPAILSTVLTLLIIALTYINLNPWIFSYQGPHLSPAQTLLTPLKAQELYDQITSQTPSIVDPLRDQDFNVNKWDENPMCVFTQEAYSIYTFTQVIPECYAEKLDLRNFAFQIKMTIVKGDGGGVAFRADQAVALKEYRFYISNEDTHYDLTMSRDIKTFQTIANNSISAIIPGLKRSYLLGVIAQGSYLYLYLNDQYLSTVKDNTYSSGRIGLFALNYNGKPGEIDFNDAKIWKL